MPGEDYGGTLAHDDVQTSENPHGTRNSYQKIRMTLATATEIYWELLKLRTDGVHNTKKRSNQNYCSWDEYPLTC